MKILLTGSAGFIGFHATLYFLKRKHEVIGIDNINSYYDIKLKQARLKILEKYKKFSFYKIDLKNNNKLLRIFKNNKFDAVIHLAAQAGVRNSISDPNTYLDSNLVGFFNLIELVRKFKTNKFIFASTSSVYGHQNVDKFKENLNTDKPIQFYAATKKSNEVIAYSYSHLFNIKTIGLRFFTVYGPFGRPDMALFKFTKNIIEDKPIEIFNHGNHFRDFTYINDIVKGIYLATKKNQKITNFRIYNLGKGQSISLKKFISQIELILNKKAIKKYLPMQKGDTLKTYSNINLAKKDLGYYPTTEYKSGIKKFINWYKKFYKI